MRLTALAAFAALSVFLPILPGADGEPSDRTADARTPQPSYDWLIRGGSVVDGTGAPARTTDVLLRGDRIAHVGTVDPDTLSVGRTFDAAGLTVTPGFVDSHAHGDPLEGAAFENFRAQGVTTIVLGQDGGSPPVAELEGRLDAVDDARPGVNVAYLVGHATLRRESGVGFDDPGPDGRRRMADLVARGMDAGAFGLSTGLEYTPGNQAGPDELAAVAEPVADRDGIVMSHVRNEDADQVDASVRELLEQGRRSGAAVHVSHMKVVLGSDPADARRILDMMAEARAEGLEVSGDVYPYVASFTGLSLLFPDWARPPNDYREVVRERRAELAAHLRRRVESRNGPQATLFGSGPYSGMTLAEAADEAGRPFEDVLIDLGPDGASAAYFVMDEDVMSVFLAGEGIAVSSDGSPTMYHPRGYGSFARVIRQFVREEGLLSLEEAVRKMSSLPASVLGLDDPEKVDAPRGEIREGWAADLAVFDPARVRDRADFQNPHRLAEGMEAVWVNGEPAWMDGAPVGEGHGKALRRR